MKITITKFYEADDGGSGGIDWYQEFKRVNKELTELKSQFQHPGKHKWLRHEEHPCKSCVAQPEFYTNYESDTIAPPYELDKEAKELVEKFRMVICQMDDDTMTFSATDKDGNDISDDIRIDAYEGSLGDAKQCAIIHCDLMLKELPMYTGNLNPRWKHYKDLKQKIEAL